MLTLRYFLVIGVGAIISLNYVEPVSSNPSASATSPATQESQIPIRLLKISNSIVIQPLAEEELVDMVNQPLYSEFGMGENSVSAKEQPVQPPETEEFVVQSPQSEITTPADRLVEEVPSLEFLNPSANPLLFPTKPNEVQIENTQAITLEQSLELARNNNREFQTARLELERSEFVLQQALAAELPTASFTTDITRIDSAQTEIQNRLTGATQDTSSTVINPMLTLNYNVFTSGLRSANIRRAEEGKRFRQLDLERILEQLRLDVSQAYYQLQLADAQVIINQAAVTNAEEVLRDAQLREQAGLGTKFDVLQQQVQLANFIQDLTNARRDQRVARRQIVSLLSLAQDTEISAADPITVAGQWELSIDESIVLAFKNRAELQQRLTERDIAEQDRRIALADIRPQVSVFATYDILDVFDDTIGPADGFTLGARFSWDFFDGGSARARARQAENDIAIADTNFADTRNSIRLQVEQAFFDLKANEQNIQTATLAVKQAEESLRLAELRVGAGVGTQLEVINQQTELTRARNSLVSAILNYNIGLANLQRAISNLPDSKLFDLTY
ncbi:MAG: TolC family protein [Symploca sp. SIO2G7]|nr:TolC family protein [Symploca sp. SIO2G7]